MPYCSPVSANPISLKLIKLAKGGNFFRRRSPKLAEFLAKIVYMHYTVAMEFHNGGIYESR